MSRCGLASLTLWAGYSNALSPCPVKYFVIVPDFGRVNKRLRKRRPPVARKGPAIAE